MEKGNEMLLALGAAGIYAVATFVGVCFFLAKPIQERISELTRQVSVEADKNWDGFTSQREWVKVYKEVRPKSKYDSRNPSSDLMIGEMEAYLRNNARP